MHISDFDFELPDELIAQHPPAVRGSSRLLAALPGEPLRDVQFADLPQWLQPGDVMVFNNTKVMKARERQHFDIALKDAKDKDEPGKEDPLSLKIKEYKIENYQFVLKKLIY